MASTDWVQEDSTLMNPNQSTVSTNDLFGGELFGDELLDIYDGSVGNDASTGMFTTNGEPDKESSEYGNPDGQISASPSSSDGDGLGAFRPSTSFNDLTSLLSLTSSPSNAAGNETSSNCDEQMASSELNEETSGNKKRHMEAMLSPEESPRKKLATVPRTEANLKSSNKNKVRSIMVKQEYHLDPSMKSTSTGSLIIPSTQTSELKIKQEYIDSSTTSPDASYPTMEVEQHKVQVGQSIHVQDSTAGETTQTPLAVVTPRESEDQPLLSAENIAIATSSFGQAPAPSERISLLPKALSSSSLKTETDFKSVAQAAVSNLILNAGNSARVSCSGVEEAVSTRIDTSTAHIKALTGNNWVAACSGIGNGGGNGVAGGSVGGGTSSNGEGGELPKTNNRGRKQNITADERARQNRDRNREHARNTRLRKKAYVEELKRSLAELVSQRDASELQKRQAAQREAEQREVRFRVIKEFLKLRGTNERNRDRWAAILDTTFVLRLPNTQYRETVGTGLESSQLTDQTLTGVTEVMADSSHVSRFLQTITGKGDCGNKDMRRPITLLYNCNRDSFFMDGSNAVLDWSVTSVGAVEKGARSELLSFGTLRACFSPASNKLLSAKIIFDTHAILSQIDCSSSFSIGDPSVEIHDAFNANHGNGVGEVMTNAVADDVSKQADAILDSLQMPHFEGSFMPQTDQTQFDSSQTTMGYLSTGADIYVSASEKGECSSSDESMLGDATSMTERPPSDAISTI